MNTKPLNVVLIALLIAAISESCAQDHIKRYDDLLTELFKEDTPGGTAIIVKNGKTIYHKAFGKADLELDVDMEPGHIFRIGSITKQFTACAILRLEEEGKLSLQDDITKYIIDYPSHGYQITIEHLLTHTSGIRSYTSMSEWDQEVQRKDFTPEEMIDYFKSEPMDFAPGDQFLYNNSAYFLLGHIIEIVSGKSYSQYIQEEFFAPLGMENSSYGNTSRVIRNRAKGYQLGNGGFQNAPFLSMSQPYSAGALLSTVEDLSIWYHAVLDGMVISDESLAIAHRAFRLNNGSATNYGYGWFLGNIQGSPMIEHGGGIHGFLTASLFLPGEKIFVAVFSNCTCHVPANTAFKLAAITINKPYEWEETRLKDEILEEYPAVYETSEGKQVIITLEEGNLYSMRTGGRKSWAFPFEKDKFFYKDDLSTLHFNRDKKDRIVSLTTVSTHKSVIYHRTDKPIPVIEPMDVEPEELEKYAGRYELAPSFILSVTTEGDKIFVQATGQPRLEIIAIEDHKFQIVDVDARIEFHPEEDGKISSLTLFQNGEHKAHRIE